MTCKTDQSTANGKPAQQGRPKWKNLNSPNNKKTALRKAIGDIIGDYTPWVLIVETTPLGETATAYSESVTDTHSSAFTIIGLLDNELTQRLS